MPEERLPAKNYTVIFGSNTYENCGNVITIRNKEVLSFTRGRDGKLLLTAEMKGKTGKLIAKIVNGSVVFANKHLKIDQTIDSVVVSEKRSNESLLEVRTLDTNTLEVNGIFHVDGISVDASRERTVMPNGMVVQGSKFTNCKTGIAIN